MGGECWYKPWSMPQYRSNRRVLSARSRCTMSSFNSKIAFTVLRLFGYSVSSGQDTRLED